MKHHSELGFNPPHLERKYHVEHVEGIQTKRFGEEHKKRREDDKEKREELPHDHLVVQVPNNKLRP